MKLAESAATNIEVLYAKNATIVSIYSIRKH